MAEQSYANSQTKVPRPLRRLIEAHQSVADIESLEVLLPNLLDLARNVTNAEAASFMLYDPKREVLEFPAVSDEVLGKEKVAILKDSVELKLGEGIAGWVAENRKLLNIEDAQKDPRLFKQADKKTGFVTRNLLCVPLLYLDELLGVINVLNCKDKPCFDAFDEELLECFAQLASTAIIRSRSLEARLRQQRVEVQLEAAWQIQSLFLPKVPEIGGGSTVWAVSIPAYYVGGDLYDVIPMPDDSWLVCVADISGKGLPAALMMAALTTKIRGEAALHHEVDALLNTVNNDMYHFMVEEGFFATVILGKYWPDSGRMQFTLGGHPSPLWIGGGDLKKVPQIKSIALGVLPEVEYEKREIILSPGESLLFLTDGVTDAENARGEFFGHGGIMNYLQKANGPPWGEGLLETVKVWQGEADRSDDLTMLEIWRDPV